MKLRIALNISLRLSLRKREGSQRNDFANQLAPPKTFGSTRSAKIALIFESLH